MKVPEGAIRAAYAVIEQALVITSKEGVILYANPTCEKVTGYGLEELLGQTPRVFKSGFHDPAFYQTLWDKLLSGETFRARFVNKRKNGDLYHEEQTIAPLKNKQGEITYFISTAIDLTKQVAGEEAKKLAEDSYRHLQSITWTREERVMDLKREVNSLLQQLGKAPKYLD